MSLLTSHSSANRVVDSALVVTYSVSRVSGYWEQQSSMGITVASHDHMWEYHRRARKSYRYVGMTEAAAKTCKDAMTSLYTRSTSTMEWDSFDGIWTTTSGSSIPMADVAMSHNDDGSYDVVVNVYEDDCRMSILAVTATSLFSSERSRSYDGEYEVEPSS